jgi:hypothetical protein
MPDLIGHPPSALMQAGGETMHRFTLMLGATAMLAACGQSNDNAAANQAVPKPKKKPAYCFFKDPETKDWAASRDKDGNIIVKGKAYRSDSRYQAVLQNPVVTGTSAEISPTIIQNGTGYGAPDNWWDVRSTIPNSAGVTTVTVRCGAKAVATLHVPPSKS